jgi:hypothetical protein
MNEHLWKKKKQKVEKENIFEIDSVIVFLILQVGLLWINCDYHLDEFRIVEQNFLIFFRIST